MVRADTTVIIYCPVCGGHPLGSAIMMLPTAALSLLLAPEGPPPPDTWQGHEAECRRLEDAVVAGSREPGPGYVAAGDECRGAFEAVPDGGKAMDQRSYFLFEAHRLYQLAHAAGDAAGLCADRRALEMFAVQLSALKPGERARDRQDVKKMQEQVTAQLAAPCPNGKPKAMPKEQVRDGTAAHHVTPTSVASTLRPTPSPARSDPGPTRPRRPLRIAGGTTLGLGLGLGAGMIGALVHGGALHEQAAAMTYEGQLIPEADVGQFTSIDARGHRADSAAIGLGVAGGLLAVVGVSLLVVDARQGRAARRVALGSSVLPTAGIRLTMEF